jgi:hypothetical protein
MSKTETRDGQRSKREVLEEFPDPRRNTRQVTGDSRRHTDTDSIRRFHGVAPFDRSAYDFQDVLPNLFIHTRDGGEDMDAGGTDLLATGKPGSGKSTQACHFATRVMEINDETVVWRASSTRSEWLPLAPWATVCLPRSVEHSIELEPMDPMGQSLELDVDELEEIVREVVYYDDPIDLNQNVLGRDGDLGGGRLAVVYPDPSMNRCDEIYRDSPYRKEDLEFSSDDPPKHWWFAWLLARIDRGPHHWMTWICDEIGDLVPQNARKDEFGTYQKVELARDLWVDARKKNLTILSWGHSEVDVHQMLRHKVRWRIQMPGRANPTSKGDLVGFGSVPMDFDVASQMRIGEGLMYTERHFQRFRWPEYEDATDYKLKISQKI